MISLLISILFAAPHTVIVNGQRMNEWPPVVYDLESRSLVINDFICDNFLPLNIPKSQDEALKAGSLNAIFFKKTGRFYIVNQMTFNPQTLTWFVTTFDTLVCDQITIFRDGFE